MIGNVRRTRAGSPTAAVVALLVLVSLVGGGRAPAAADEVGTAQAQVDKLQGLVAATAVTLTEGTRRYEADRSSLATATQALARSQRAIVGAQAQADAGSAKLNALAKQMYMSPMADGLTLAFTQRPDSVLDSLEMRNDVQRVAGSQTDVIRAAIAARTTLQGDQLLVLQLTSQAALLADRSAATLRGLQALAADTAARLSSAQGALTAARGRAAARIAAASALAERAARNARDRAALAALANQARAASFATCSGASTSGQANGNLDPASLCPLWKAPGQELVAAAAAAFATLSKAHAAEQGAPSCVADSYRSYSRQVDMYQRHPDLAAVPGTSEHGWGRAVDFCGGVERFGSAAYNWMTNNASRFGFFHPAWAEPGGSKPEPWHWEFGG